jgi:hypothetical protein
MVFLAVFAMAAESPFAGTWKFNPSKGHPIPPAPKSSTAHIEADDHSFKLDQQFVDDKGQSADVSFDPKFDGKEYPVKGDPDTDTVSLHRVNEREITFTYRKAGKITSKIKAMVSKDGKTTTLLVTDLSQNKPQTGTYVYDKQ